MSTKDFSNLQEKRIAKTLGGRTQPASGALPLASKKSDVQVSSSENWKLLVSAKTSMVKTHQAGKRSFTLKKEWLEEVKHQASEGGYDIGVVSVSFDNRKDYYITEDIDFRNIVDALHDYEKIIDTNNKLKSSMLEFLTFWIKELQSQVNSKNPDLIFIQEGIDTINRFIEELK
jgi:hypothetical protein